jgi:hypothetical protein
LTGGTTGVAVEVGGGSLAIMTNVCYKKKKLILNVKKPHKILTKFPRNFDKKSACHEEKVSKKLSLQIQMNFKKRRLD